MNQRRFKRKRIYTYASNSLTANTEVYPVKPNTEKVYTTDNNLKKINTMETNKMKTPVVTNENTAIEVWDMEDFKNGRYEEENNFFSLGEDDENELGED